MRGLLASPLGLLIGLALGALGGGGSIIAERLVSTPAHPLEKRVLLAGFDEDKSWSLDVFEKKLGGYKGARKAVGMEEQKRPSRKAS